MSDARATPRSAYLAAPEILTVLSQAPSSAAAEIYIAIHRDGKVIAFNGHVDLGTGIRTALAQIVAEELDAPFEQVEMVLGTTSADAEPGCHHRQRNHPGDGNPAASGRRDGASLSPGTGRRTPRAVSTTTSLSTTASSALGRATIGASPSATLSAGRQTHLTIDPQAPLKPVVDYRLVGTSPAARRYPGQGDRQLDLCA